MGVHIGLQGPEGAQRVAQALGGAAEPHVLVHRAVETLVCGAEECVGRGRSRLASHCDLVPGRLVPGGVRPGPEAPDEAFEQRGRGQSVGPVNPGPRTLANGVQPAEAGPSTGVHVHPAAEEMLGGHHGNAFRGIDAVLGAHRREVRERFGEVEGRDVEHDLSCPVVRLLHRPGHHVARGQLGVRVDRRHEPLALGVAEDGALAPHGLAHEERVAIGHTDGGVKLHKLHVARRGPSAGGHRDAVARRPGRIRGATVEGPDAAGGQDRGPGALAVRIAVRLKHGPVDLPVVLQELNRRRVAPNLDASVLGQVLQERLVDVLAG